MLNQKYLRAILGVALIVLAGAAAMEAKTRQGEKDFKLGVAAEAKMDWDTAVAMYQKAVDESPTDLAYQIAMRRARFQGGQKHVEAGVKLRLDNKLEEAIQEFRKAIVMDPSSSIAIQELKQSQQMVLDGKATSTDGLTPAEKTRKEEDARVESIQGLPTLRPSLVRLPSPFKMNNSMPQILFKTVANAGGLYVNFDPQYNSASSKPFDVNLDNMTIAEAFDYLAFITHTVWKPITSNTIFVYEDTTAKRRDYEDEVARVFYIPNASSVQEFQEIANVIRSVVEVRRVATINAGKAMLVRGTADQVALVEKLLHDLDKPKAEVVVDVMIMQANTTRSKQLAATIASGGTAGLNLPITFTPNGTTTTASTTTTGSTTTPVTTTPTTTTPTGTTGSVTLNSLGHISTSSFSTSSLPGALLEAMLTDTKTKVLNSPQVRASDGMKSELQVGLRIPYATGSLGSAVGATTVGVSPLVQTQFSYVDTGVTVIIQPQVHSADEVTMHVEITVSSVQQYESLGGGLTQPVISQEKNITDVRMRNNEVSLLGGLNQTTDATTVNGIPGLSSIPVLGTFLFGSKSTEKDSDQIVIAMIPHIVRTPDYSPVNMREIYAGTDQNIKIVHAQIDKPLIIPVVPVPAGGAPPAAGSPAVVPPAVVPPTVVPPVTAPQAPGQPTPAPPAVPPPGVVPQASAQPVGAPQAATLAAAAMPAAVSQSSAPAPQVATPPTPASAAVVAQMAPATDPQALPPGVVQEAAVHRVTAPQAAALHATATQVTIAPEAPTPGAPQASAVPATASQVATLQATAAPTPDLPVVPSATALPAAVAQVTAQVATTPQAGTLPTTASQAMVAPTAAASTPNLPVVPSATDLPAAVAQATAQPATARQAATLEANAAQAAVAPATAPLTPALPAAPSAAAMPAVVAQATAQAAMVAPATAPAAPTPGVPQATAAPATATQAAVPQAAAVQVTVAPATAPSTTAFPAVTEAAAPQSATSSAAVPQSSPKKVAPPAGAPAAAVAAPAAGGGARLSFLQGPVRAPRNGTFTLTMQLEGGSGAVSFAPLQIKFDPSELHLDNVAAGDLLTHDGGLATTEKDIRNDAGEASLTFKRSPSAGGVSGSGPLATFTFSANGKGKGTVSIIEASMKNSQAQALPVLLGSVPVTVQ